MTGKLVKSILIVGKSGSGKSTLINVINGVRPGKMITLTHLSSLMVVKELQRLTVGDRKRFQTFPYSNSKIRFNLYISRLFITIFSLSISFSFLSKVSNFKL